MLTDTFFLKGHQESSSSQNIWVKSTSTFFFIICNLQTPYAFINEGVSFQKICKKKYQKYVVSSFRLVHRTFRVIVFMPFYVQISIFL